MSTELLIEANVSKKVLYECLEFAKEFEAKYSAYKNDSLVSKINNASGLHAIKCTKNELIIFKKAIEIAKISDGAFDPTIGVLTQGLYGFGTSKEKIPSASELQEYKKYVNYNNVSINEYEIFLKDKGMRLDLGGIGKGYVVDEIIKILINRGSNKALVSVGGEICSIGRECNIAIKDPFSDNNIALIKTSKEPMSISTSGDYERFIKSRKNHHILDNKSASQNHYYSSITIIQNGVDLTSLDAVATIAFNTKPSELKKLVSKFDVCIIAITPDRQIHFENFAHLNLLKLEIFPFT